DHSILLKYNFADGCIVRYFGRQCESIRIDIKSVAYIQRNFRWIYVTGHAVDGEQIRRRAVEGGLADKAKSVTGAFGDWSAVQVKWFGDQVALLSRFEFALNDRRYCGISNIEEYFKLRRRLT